MMDRNTTTTKETTKVKPYPKGVGYMDSFS